MSQALQERTVTFGPDRLPIPKGSTALQVKLAARMLTFDAEKDTFYGVLTEVGYSPVTASADPRDILCRPGVERAAKALVARQVDSARSIHKSSLAQLGRRINDNARDELILGAVKVTSDVLASGATDDIETLSPQDREASLAYIRRVALAAIEVFKASRCENADYKDATLPLDVIDTIAVRCQSSELTQCSLSDLTPHTPTSAPTIEASVVEHTAVAPDATV